MVGLFDTCSKRLFDVLVSGVVLVFSAPLLVLIAVLIKLDSPGPVFFLQWRVGRGRKPFRIVKFRTMMAGAANRGPAITVGDDPRITLLGRILRRYHLDELPNLLNVLVGDMSLIGPRPEVPRYLPYFGEEHGPVFEVRPGLVDLATLQFRHEAEILARSEDPERTYVKEILPEKLRLSLSYLRNRSFAFDLRIIARTLLSLLAETRHPKPLARAGEWLLSHRRPFILLSHLTLFAISFAFAFLLRFDLPVPLEMQELFWITLPLLLAARSAIFARYHLYEGLWCYVGIWDVMAILKAVTLSSLIFAVLVLLAVGHGFPRAVLVTDFLLCVTLTTGVRMVMRIYRELAHSTPGLEKRNALIVGAGDAGEMLVREIERWDGLEYCLVGFLDDDPALRGHRIHGLQVLGQLDELPDVCRQKGVEEVLIAIPSAGSEVQRRVVRLCMTAGVVPKTVPTLRELLEGRARIGQLQEIRPEELLGRQAVRLDVERIRAEIQGRTVLVTGAAGSIGSELCRQIVSFRPRKLVLYERAESALYVLATELEASRTGVELVPVVGDILDAALLREIMDEQPPDVVFHAAAYKHVPLMEDQPLESIRNNLLGTEIVARASARAGAKKFVLISTDKAVRPVGVMGMTKNAAERFIRSLSGGPTMFTAVRFGNVLGSNGSVLPLFERQIALGGPVTVTDPEATRYFMLVSEAAQLVLQAGVTGENGEIYFLDMGEPMRIMDMAENLIRLHGLNPQLDVRVEVVGLRRGERLTEELVMDLEELLPSGHEKVYRVRSAEVDRVCFLDDLELLRELVDSRQKEKALGILKRMVGSDETASRSDSPEQSYSTFKSESA